MILPTALPLISISKKRLIVTFACNSATKGEEKKEEKGKKKKKDATLQPKGFISLKHEEKEERTKDDGINRLT